VTAWNGQSFLRVVRSLTMEMVSILHRRQNVSNDNQPNDLTPAGQWFYHGGTNQGTIRRTSTGTNAERYQDTSRTGA
jgi:hypothetical protein